MHLLTLSSSSTHSTTTTMASACINNITLSPDSFLDLPSWLSPSPSPEPDFEFPLHHKPTTSTMLPADQLFSDGKLLPLHLTKPSTPQTPKSPSSTTFSAAAATTTTTDPYLFSPKAPRCSSRWKDLLGLKKLYQTNPTTTTTTTKTTPSVSSSKTLKNLLHRNTTKTTSSLSSTSENAPLLTTTTISSDSESLSISSSRLSLSSSSSSHDHDELPRLSLDSDKPNPNPNNLNQISLHRNPNPNPNPRIRLVKPRPGSFDANRSDQASRTGRSPIRRESDTAGCRGVSVDSPRMNSSGKIVFQSLERSSSSPSTFNGGPRFKHRGMERSYSANVRVTPVLNVPVCSLRGTSKSGSVFGFGQLFSSPQKKDGTGNGNKGGTHHHHHHQQSSRNRN